MDREKDLQELVSRLKLAAGENLRAAVLYGSAVDHEFHEHSDLNVLCLLHRLGGADLENLRPVGLWWWRNGHPPPLLFTLAELRNSADVFSIELLDMKARHRMLEGADFLAELEVPMARHKLQVERELRTNVIRLRQSFLRWRGWQSELAELRHIGGWEAAPGREKVPAVVVGFFPHEDRVTLNVGNDRGIRPGMPVATYEGLVGRVETVDRSTSQVLLITSPSNESRITAIVRREPPNPPQAGLIIGQGPDSLLLELADPTATVQTGDIVTTSGFSDQIPRGIVIGKIVRVDDDPVFGKRTATVFPRIALGQLREVVVIK